MQAVILAAGRGTRMGALTANAPKSMLEVAGKTLLEHKFDALPREIDEIVIVVGYLGDVIRERYGDSYKGRHIVYVEQRNPVAGTMDALLKARPSLVGKFLVMNGDNIYGADDMRHMLDYEWATGVVKVDAIKYGAKVAVARDGTVLSIAELGEHDGGAGFNNINLYTLDTRIFDYPPVPKATGSTELGLPQTILAASKKSGILFYAVEATFWVQIKDAEDLARAEKILREQRA
jgi:NDP-sugar pyrophosphorylase family protein